MDDLVKLLDGNLAAVTALLGTLIGGFITKITQENLFKKQISMDEKKEKEKKTTEILNIFSDILKLDGETMIIDHNQGNITEFDLGLYKKVIRPKLFERLYLLPKNINGILFDIDRLIRICNFEEGISEEYNDELVDKYIDLISEIKNQINSYYAINNIEIISKLK